MNSIDIDRRRNVWASLIALEMSRRSGGANYDPLPERLAFELLGLKAEVKWLESALQLPDPERRIQGNAAVPIEVHNVLCECIYEIGNITLGLFLMLHDQLPE